MHSANSSDLPRLRELFARANDAPYDLAAVTEEKCFGPGFEGRPVVTVHGDFAGASVTCGEHLRILAVDRAHRRRGIGTALLREAAGRGARIVAAEGGNYFTPGVAESDVGSTEYFAKRGRRTAATQNLVTTELPPAIPAGVERGSERSRERVLDFIAREFGPVWRFEVMRAFANDPPTIFFAEHDGAVAGFAAHDANNHGLGFFGPTGVTNAHRGLGIGSKLLHASLADLRRLGHERVIIPWTAAVNYYARSCNATIAERFATFLIDSAP